MTDVFKLKQNLEEKYPSLKPSGNSMALVFGKLVFAKRIRENLSQVELAKRAGVGVKTIYRIEGGNDGITTKIYDKVFLVLGINFEDVAQFEDTQKKDELLNI
ncbi:helix-turn-helix transcriptional regulator [Aureibacillus halotolerans]|uniref:DNA-binding XRE family transcriptional regulator n=1 Tax=Aureibacillus halotolerans TaxID=1508390 RepID=A0A4R6U410_9BACI|nr:helix-turn-helix transcriptional regulator [Aureibacillus halotolerans]TDQ39259.1 DNA-binding XRE family transcriptional regulator [Aureibacillus halotolerans]